MWKGGGAGGRFRDQWEVVSKGLKGCQKGGIVAEYFYFNIISIIVLSLLLKTCFALFILIGKEGNVRMF